jgi:hypothetical protein
MSWPIRYFQNPKPGELLEPPKEFCRSYLFDHCMRMIIVWTALNLSHQSSTANDVWRFLKEIPKSLSQWTLSWPKRSVACSRSLQLLDRLILKSKFAGLEPVQRRLKPGTPDHNANRENQSFSKTPQLHNQDTVGLSKTVPLGFCRLPWWKFRKIRES